jgi:hypothetical protein
MAGLGRKVFTAGEVLTAANVQDYLQDQAVMVFAGSAARGSALGTAVVGEGMVTYLTDVNRLEVYTTFWEQVWPVSSISGTITGGQVQFGGTSITASMTATASVKNQTIYVSSGTVTVTVPDVLELWDTVTIWRNDGGTVTIAAGTGVTSWAGAGTAGTSVSFKIDQQYNAATVQKVAANTYRVVGKITV